MRRGGAFGSLLRAERTKLGLTQRALAHKLGIKASHVAYLEGGKRRPSVALLLRLSKVLKSKPSTLALRAIPELAKLGFRA